MPNKKQIVFFCATTPYVMIYKIALEYKKRGYETILITISKKEAWEESWYSDGFDKIICSNFQLKNPTPVNSWDMLKRLPYLIRALYQMKKLNPYVVFGIARPNLITSFALRFFKKYPFIYFPYDITSQRYPDLSNAIERGIKKREINAERYCFENADGILHKGDPDGLKYLSGKTMLGENLNITPLTINFCPYCSDEFIAPINKNKLSKKDKSCHLVYVGGLYPFGEPMKGYINIIQKLIDQKVHIHLYSKTQHLSKEEDMKNLAPLVNAFSNSKYFHMEYAVDPKKLVSEISKYDYGIEMDFLPVYIHDKQHQKMLMGNKMASFLEAGFTFFFSKKSEFESRLLKKYGLDISLDQNYNFEDFNKKLEKLNYKKLEKNVLKARKDFNMGRHFPRLEKFVEEVVLHHQNKARQTKY